MRLSILLAASLAAAVAAAPLAAYLRGGEGLVAAFVAMAVCLVAGGLATMVTTLPWPREFLLYRVVLGMFLRMSLPLFVMIPVYIHGGLLVEGGLVYYLLFFYLVTLAVETTLDVLQINTPAPQR